MGRVMCGSRVGMVQHGSQLCRCLIPVTCKQSDPFQSDSRWAQGGWDTVNYLYPFRINTINSLSYSKRAL